MPIIFWIIIILSILWGVSAFALLIKLNNEKYDSNSRIWKWTKLDSLEAPVIMFWIAYMSLGIAIGTMGLSVAIGELLWMRVAECITSGFFGFVLALAILMR